MKRKLLIITLGLIVSLSFFSYSARLEEELIFDTNPNVDFSSIDTDIWRDTGDAIHAFNIILKDRTGAYINSYNELALVAGDYIPTEVWNDASVRLGRDIKKMRYGSTTYGKTDRFVTQTMLDAKQTVTLIALEEVTIVEGGSVLVDGYLASNQLSTSYSSSSGGSSQTRQFYSNSIANTEGFNRMEITYTCSGHAYAPSGCSYRDSDLGSASGNYGASGTHIVNISGQTTIPITFTIYANNPHTSCGMSSCSGTCQITKIRLYFE